MKSIDNFTEVTLMALERDKSQESISLEFKERLPGTSDSEKKEFLKDVCAMANSSGGDILYGIKENSGSAEQIVPVYTESADDAMRRLGQLLDSCIEPRLQGVRMKPVELSSTGGYVLVVRVPQSQSGPHRVAYQGQYRFLLRNETHISDMSYEQLRMAFDRTATLTERARAFRQERVAIIAKKQVAKQPAIGTTALVHLMPLNGIRGQVGIDVLAAYGKYVELAFGNWGSISRNLNLDGLMVYQPGIDGALTNYVQLYRTGIVEIFSASFNFLDNSGKSLIASLALAEFYRTAIHKAMSMSSKFGMEGGAYVGISLLSLGGAELMLGQMFNMLNSPKADRNDLVLPEFWVEDLDQFNIDDVARPILDMLWQCFGLERCNYFDANGKWNSGQRIS